MQTKKMTRLAAMLLAAAVSAGPMLAQSQADKHVVSLGELNKDAAGPAETRRANEAEIRQLFATVDGQKALKTANVDYAKIDRAVSSMSDEDVARISDRARAIDRDFAAGSLTRPRSAVDFDHRADRDYFDCCAALDADCAAPNYRYTGYIVRTWGAACCARTDHASCDKFILVDCLPCCLPRIVHARRNRIKTKRGFGSTFRSSSKRLKVAGRRRLRCCCSIGPRMGRRLRRNARMRTRFRSSFIRAKDMGFTLRTWNDICANLDFACLRCAASGAICAIICRKAVR